MKWIDIAMFAIGLPSEVDQNASMFYIDAMEHLGLPADVCPEPAAESGCAVVDDYPRVGKCYFTGTMPCDGAISQTNILTRHFKELPRSRSRRRSVSTNRKYRPMRSRT